MRRLLIIVVVVVLGFAQPTFAAIAFVDHVATTGTGASAAINTSTANYLIASITGVAAVSAPTDSQSNTWTPLTGKTGSFGGGVQLFYVKNASVSATHTFTNGSTSLGAMLIEAFSGVDTTSPLDTESGANGPVTRPGSISPANNDELFVTASGGGTNAVVPIVDSGFNLTDYVDVVGGITYSNAIGYKIKVADSGAENPTWGSSGGDDGVVMAAFKSGGGGPPACTAPASQLTTVGVGNCAQ